jgi:hypothetical protein
VRYRIRPGVNDWDVDDQAKVISKELQSTGVPGSTASGLQRDPRYGVYMSAASETPSGAGII